MNSSEFADAAAFASDTGEKTNADEERINSILKKVEATKGADPAASQRPSDDIVEMEEPFLPGF